MDNIRSEFTVTVYRKVVVSAAVPLQKQRLRLSNLDLLIPDLEFGVFFCYKKPTATNNGQSFNFPSMVNVLKNSLAQALVSYYAFTGEVVYNSMGEPELLCHNRGVDFYEAHAEVELKNLHLYNPDATVEGKLVPKKKDGVLCVQVTELSCGGVVVACAFDHRIADAYSANMFFVSWAETAQSKLISLFPSFDHSFLTPRRPGWYDASISEMYVPFQMLPPPPMSSKHKDDDVHVHNISRIYYIKASEIERLQILCSCECDAKSSSIRRTKLESFSAFLWKIVGKASSNKKCKMGIVVDGRNRLTSSNSIIANNYFGNVFSVPYAEMNNNELTTKPLSWVAAKVHEFLQGVVTKDHFLQLIDLVEDNRPTQMVTKICTHSHRSEDSVAFVVSSGQRFPVSKVDFGWGRPLFGSYHFPWSIQAGYVMPMPNASENGDWIVFMHLLETQLALLEAEAAHVFKPLTSDYLNF